MSVTSQSELRAALLRQKAVRKPVAVPNPVPTPVAVPHPVNPNPGNLLNIAHTLLDNVAQPRAGRKPSQNRHRSKHRPEGIAHRVAQLFVVTLAAVNYNRGLSESPLTLREILIHHPEGQQILHEHEDDEHSTQLKQNAIDLVKMSGKAMTADVLGTLCRGIPVPVSMSWFEVSESTIRRSVKTMGKSTFDPNAKGVFQTMDRTQHHKPSRITEEETVPYRFLVS